MALSPMSAAPGMTKLQLSSRDFSVRPNGADRQWGKAHPTIVGKILVANEWLDWVTYRIEASHAWWLRELNLVWS